MKSNKINRSSKKNSIAVSSPKLLQALQKMLLNEGGSVSYVFISERYKRTNFINKKGDKDFFLEPIQVKSTQHVNVGLEALKGEKPDTLKSPEELALMFHTTKTDLGAAYFIID